MQKNKRAEGDHRPRRTTVPPDPSVLHMDDLAVMSDDDLFGRYRELDEHRKCADEMLVDARQWEEELAYTQRELAIRRHRRELHGRWLRQEAEYFAHSEDGLPVFDFDNSAFVYAASGGRPRWN